MRPDFDLALAPGEIEIRMMAFRFCHGPHLVHVGQGQGEILERIQALKMAGLVLSAKPSHDPMGREVRRRGKGYICYQQGSWHHLLVENQRRVGILSRPSILKGLREEGQGGELDI